jgi:protoporphyrinogen IX oxidase
LERVSLIALKALEAGASVRGRDGFHQCGRRVASLLLVLLLSGVHGFFVRYVKDFAADRNTRSQRFYRFINEVPTVLMIGIVILVIVKPF